MNGNSQKISWQRKGKFGFNPTDLSVLRSRKSPERMEQNMVQADVEDAEAGGSVTRSDLWLRVILGFNVAVSLAAVALIVATYRGSEDSGEILGFVSATLAWALSFAMTFRRH